MSTRASHGSGEVGKGYLVFGNDEVLDSCHIMELDGEFQPSPPHPLRLYPHDL